MTYFLFACILTSSDAAQYCTAVGIRLCITVSIHERYRIQPGDTVLSSHKSVPHQYGLSYAGPIRYMQPCITLKTECTFDAIRQYSLCTTVSIQKLPHGIDTPTYHCIGTVPYPYMTSVTFNRNTQYCPTTIGTVLIKRFLYRTFPSLTALRHAKSRTNF